MNAFLSHPVGVGKFETTSRIERDNKNAQVYREILGEGWHAERMMTRTAFRLRLAALFVLLPTFMLLQTVRSRAQSPEWTEAFPPFRIMGNLYYVGSKDLASYLVVTPAGNILINSNLESSVPQIRSWDSGSAIPRFC
jgi:metallo-beta-lactamase class B